MIEYKIDELHIYVLEVNSNASAGSAESVLRLWCGPVKIRRAAVALIMTFNFRAVFFKHDFCSVCLHEINHRSCELYVCSSQVMMDCLEGGEKFMST